MVLVKPALLILAAAGIATCLRRAPASARHALWVSAIAATLLVPLLGVILPPLRVPVLSGRAGPHSPRGVAPDQAAWHPGAVGDDAGIPARRGTGTRGGGRASSRVPRPDGLLVVWVLGVLVCGAGRVAAQVHAGRLLRRAARASTRVQDAFSDAAKRAGVRGTGGLCVSDETPGPAVAGAWRPAVVLPAEAEHWPDVDLAAVFHHELGHVRRRDGLWNLVADVAAALYWCNPAVHFARRRMKSEAERACDDRVLRTGTAAEAYAHLLLRIAAGGRLGGDAPVAVIAMARPRELEARLLAVLDARVSRRPLSRGRVLTLAVLAIVLAAPTAALTPTRRADPAATLPPEPDQLGDSVAAPSSERLPPDVDAYAVPHAARPALAGPDSALIRRLVAALGHEPAHEADLIRERAHWALSRAREGRLVEPLLDSLDAADWRVRSYATWALATARDPRAVERLLPLLGHPVWRVRAMAAYALREAGDPMAAAAMRRALDDPAWQVRVEAVQYLARLGDADVERRLAPLLRDRHVAVRLAARRALSPTP